MPNRIPSSPLPLPVHRVLALPPDMPPTLTVVIDTEEEFDWHAPLDPANTSVGNIAAQPMAQAVFDAHGVVPTYVVDYPVATTPAAVAVLRPIMESGRCEIGAHLHPWVNPPDPALRHPSESFPLNLRPVLLAQKLERLTEAITASFGRRPVVYKAGRYGIGAETLPVLDRLGYRVDASVVPRTSFAAAGGPDFTAMPEGPFFASPRIVALPLSVHYVGRLAPLGPSLFPLLHAGPLRLLRLPGIAARLGLLERLRLSPEGHSLADLVRQTKTALAAGGRYFMLTYHSSALHPGSTDYVRTEEERQAFLRTLDRYLRFFLGLSGARARTVSALAAELAP